MTEDNNDGVTVKRSAETSLDEFGAILREMRGRILGEDRIKYTLPADEALAFADRLGRVKDAIEQERRHLRSLVARFANCHEDNEDFGALLREARFVLDDTPYAVVDGEPVVVLHGRVAEKAGADERPFVGVDLAKDKPTTVCVTIAPGNAAALRDVVESLCEISPNDEVELSKLSKRLIADDIYGGGLVEKIVRDMAKARAALAAPARNCDVGTEKEQHERFVAFCDSHGDCVDCPIKAEWHKALSCGILWAQMPYAPEKGGAKC